MPSRLEEVEKQRLRSRPRQVNRTPELDKAGRQNPPWVIPDKGSPVPAARLSGEGPRPDADYRGNTVPQNSVSKRLSSYMENAVRNGLNAGGTKLAPDTRPVYGPQNQRMVADNRPVYGPENRSWLGRGWDFTKKVWDTATNWGGETPVAPAPAVAATTAAAAGGGIKPKPSGSEKALADRTAAAIDRGKIDYDRPFWWMDENLGDKKPIHLIRGTEQSWYSPFTGTEFASPQEAYEGVSRAEKLDLRDKLAERAHELTVEKMRGGYKVQAAEAGEKRWEELKSGTGLGGEPSIFNVETGEYMPLTGQRAKITDADLKNANEALAEAMALKDMADDAAVKALVQIKKDTQRALIFDALSRMYPDKAKSMARKIAELQSTQEEPLFE